MDSYIRAPIEPLLGFKDQDERREENAGRQDGKRAGANASVGELARKQEGYMAAAGAQLVIAYTRFQERSRQQRSEADDLEARMNGGLRNQKQESETKRSVELQGLETQTGPTSELQKRLRKAKQDADDSLSSKKLELRRELRVQLPTFYVPFMFLLAIAEVPINRLAFELFFQESPFISMLLALVCGASLMFFAHIVGSMARHLSFGRDTDTFFSKMIGIVTRVLGIALLLTISIVLIYFIALLRQRFADLLDAEAAAPSFGDLLTQGNIGVAVEQVANTRLRQTGWSLLVLNVVILGVGIVASFFRHDPDPDYEKIVRRQKSAEKRLSRTQAKYAKEADRLSRKHGEDVKLVTDLVEKTESDKDKRMNTVSLMASDFDGAIRAVAAVVHRQSLAYVRGYIAGARDGGHPTGSFAFEPYDMDAGLHVLRQYLPRGEL